MRQHLNDEKVHYKLYKDGKNWVAASIATGIAIPVALFSAAFLSPIQGVQATSNDPEYTNLNADGVNGEITNLILQGIKSGQFYDATVKGSSSVQINAAMLRDVYRAGDVLTLKDNQWEISSLKEKKVDFDTVLSQLGLPNPSSGTNSILSALGAGGILTMNGGNEQDVWGGITNTIVSGDGIVTGGDTKLSSTDTSKTIGQSPYTDIVSGPLTNLGNNSDNRSYKILVADGGTLQGTDRLSDVLTADIDSYSFTDGSMSDTMAQIKSAVETINQKISQEDVPTSAATDLDFSKATKDADGNYVFKVDGSTIVGWSALKFTNLNDYDGSSNVIVQFTGSSDINFASGGTVLSESAHQLGNGKLFLSLPNAQTINFTNTEAKDVTLLAPDSNIVTTRGYYAGIIGCFNGTADPSTPLNPGGNGYHQPTDGSDTLTPTDDNPGNDPTKPTDTTKTPDDGGDTTTTTPTTPKSKVVTVKQTISTSVSDKGGIDPTDIPVADLPKNTETKSTTFTATVKDDGTISYTNADGSIIFDAPFDDVPVKGTTKIENTIYTVQVTGKLTDNSGFDEDTLEAKAVTDQIGQATDGTTLNWNIAVVYFPSSTSKPGHMTVTDHVAYDFDFDDEDNDESLLPPDYDRTAELTFTETTDANGNKSYSDWAVQTGLSELKVPDVAGYTAELDGDITDDGLLQMVQGSDNPTAMQDINTDVTYTAINTSSDDTITRTVNFVDENGKSLKASFTDTATFTTKTHATSSHTTSTDNVLAGTDTAIDGYHLVDDDKNTANASFVGQSETVKDGAADENITLHYEKDGASVVSHITRTVTYVTSDGVTLQVPDVETLTFTQTPQYSPLNGTIIGYGEVPDQDFTAIEIPQFKGYTLQTPTAQDLENLKQHGVNPHKIVLGGKSFDNEEVNLIYVKNPPITADHTVTQTINFVDENGKSIKKTIVRQQKFESSTDAVTDEVSYSPASKTFEALTDAQTTIQGYDLDTTNTTAESLNLANNDQTVQMTSDDQTITLVYKKQPNTVTKSTVTRTVHFVDEQGDTIAADDTQSFTFEASTDPATGNTDYLPLSQNFAAVATNIKGYILDADRTGQATLDKVTQAELVSYHSPSDELTIYFTKQANIENNDTITRTIHFVDQNGDAIKAPITQSVVLTASTDPATGITTYTPETGHFVATDLTIKGYDIDLTQTSADDKTMAESDGEVNFGDDDQDLTIHYTKQANVDTSNTITRTVHFATEDGQPVQDDVVQTGTITQSTDPATDEVTYTPETLDFAAVDTAIAGLHIVSITGGTTDAETVGYDDASQDITVTYAHDTAKVADKTITKTVHYQYQDGTTAAPDQVATVTYAGVTDLFTGKTTYTTTDNTLPSFDNPIVENATVVVDDNETVATTAQTLTDDTATNIEVTVKYTDNVENAKVQKTKTVHYVDHAGNKVADDKSVTAEFTKTTDLRTGDVTYKTVDNILEGIANPEIKNMVATTGDIDQATSDQTVKVTDDDENLTVVYTDYTPGQLDDGVHVYEKAQTPDAPSVNQDDYYDNTIPGELDDGVHVYTKDQVPSDAPHYAVKEQVPDKAPSVTPDKYYDYTQSKLDDGVHVYEKAQVPDEAPTVTPDKYYDYTQSKLDDGVHVYEKAQVPDEAPSVTPDKYYDYTQSKLDDGVHVYEKAQVPDEAPSVTPDKYYNNTIPGQLDDGVQVKTKIQVPDAVTPDDSPNGYYDNTTVDHTPGQLDDGVQVKTKVQVPDAVTPDDSPNGYYDNTNVDHTPGQLDDGVQVKTKVQVPDDAPSVTPDGYYNHTTTTTTPGGDDGTTSTTTPGGDDGTPTTTTPGGDDGTTTTTTPGGDDGTPTTTTPGGDDGTTTTTTPGGDDGTTTTTTTPGGDDGTTTTTTPGGDDGTTTTTPVGDDGTTTTTPGGDDGTTTTTATPGGDDGTTTTTTPGGDDGTTTTTTPGGDDGTTTTTTPGGDDGTTTTTTPGGDDGMTTTTTPDGDDGTTTTTTTPDGDDGTTTTTTTPDGDNGTTTTTTPAVDGGLTTTTTTTTPNQSTPALTTTVTPNNTIVNTPATTPIRTGNGLTGQTPTSDTTTTNADGTTRRTLVYVSAEQAPQVQQTPQASDNVQPVDASKPDAIPDQTAIIADQTNAPAADDPAESVSAVANVIDENAVLTHGNIFIAGGAPGMADYTFFSQPVMDSTTNSIDHYELLLRVWDSKQGGWHLPASFSIPASMEAHLMARAVAQLDVKDISINLTDSQFEDPDTQKAITELAQSDAVDNLTIELATIPDNDQLETNAKIFQAAGVKVTLDNLGSHTDGTQLAKAADHVDTLKVSLRGMRRDSNNLTQMRNQLTAWQQAASQHNDSVEVEGIESADELAMTNDLGITAVQGYYFSRPAMPGTRADLM